MKRSPLLFSFLALFFVWAASPLNTPAPSVFLNNNHTLGVSPTKFELGEIDESISHGLALDLFRATGTLINVFHDEYGPVVVDSIHFTGADAGLLSLDATPVYPLDVSDATQTVDITLAATTPRVLDANIVVDWRRLGEYPQASQKTVRVLADIGCVRLFVEEYPAEGSGGDVTFDPAPLNPGGDPALGLCFETGAVVGIVATPALGGNFEGWLGASTSTNPSISLMMTRSTELKAFFAKPKLSIQVYEWAGVDVVEGLLEELPGDPLAPIYTSVTDGWEKEFAPGTSFRLISKSICADLDPGDQLYPVASGGLPPAPGQPQGVTEFILDQDIKGVVGFYSGTCSESPTVCETFHRRNLQINMDPPEGGGVLIDGDAEELSFVSRYFPYGDTAGFAAIPADGWAFDGWAVQTYLLDDEPIAAMQTVSMCEDVYLTARFVKDDRSEPNDSPLHSTRLALIAGAPTTTAGAMLNDEDWYRLDLSAASGARGVGAPTNVKVRATFDGSAGDLQLQLYDRRSAVGREWGQRVGESYGIGDSEEITAVNATAASDLYLRVYGEGGATNPAYDLSVEALPIDDAYDTLGARNDWACDTLPTLQTNVVYNDLILLDDDWYRVSTAGLSSLDVFARHYFHSGDLHVMVVGDDRDDCGGAYGRVLALAAGSDASRPGERLDRIDVSGRASVLIRVYGAQRQTNFYDLAVAPGGTLDAVLADPSAARFATPPSDAVAAWATAAALREAAATPAAPRAGDLNEPDNTIDTATIVPLPDTAYTVDYTGQQLNDEDWFAIELPPLTHVRTTAVFDGGLGDLQLQLWDRRADFEGGWGLLVGESYSTGDTETISYVNMTAPDVVYLRVYGESGATNPLYTLDFETTPIDDPYDKDGADNDWACSPTALALGTTYSDLICRDDDWFVFDVRGVSSFDARADHYFQSGNLHLMVVGLPEGADCSTAYDHILAGGYSNDASRNYEEVTGVDVSAYDAVLVRVFGATRQTNYYDLTASGRQ